LSNFSTRLLSQQTPLVLGWVYEFVALTRFGRGWSRLTTYHGALFSGVSSSRSDNSILSRARDFHAWFKIVRHGIGEKEKFLPIDNKVQSGFVNLPISKNTFFFLIKNQQ
jgi:hypothetical protein